MKDGNEQFREGVRRARDYLGTASHREGAAPSAVVLSCIDSRAPAEAIMDLGIGDIFNARVAGNIANDDILGSMEFACKLSGAKVVLVMGHTACGAIKGAIDNAELGNLTGLLAKIRPAVKATTFQGERSSKNPLRRRGGAKNVEMTMADIRRRAPCWRARIERHDQDRRSHVRPGNRDGGTSSRDSARRGRHGKRGRRVDGVSPSAGGLMSPGAEFSRPLRSAWSHHVQPEAPSRAAHASDSAKEFWIQHAGASGSGSSVARSTARLLAF